MACKAAESCILIDERADVVSALSDINSHDLLAVDCEGVNLGRDGELTVLTIATSSIVYIFDILQIGKGIFDDGLKNVLEDNTKKKLMFDCRRDSDSLWHHYKVKLSGVMDLQLLEVMHRMEQSPKLPGASKAIRRSARESEVESVYGYLHCLEIYNTDKESIDKKKKGNSVFDSDKSVWKKRPISDDLIDYCKVDTAGMFELFEKLKGNGEHLPRLKVASERFADLLRNLPVRCNNEYENHAFLPLDIIPEKGTLTFPYASTMCVTCRRLFPIDEFSKNQLRQKVQKCRVCKKIKLRADVQKNREDNWARDELYHESREMYYDSDDDFFYNYYDYSDDDYFGLSYHDDFSD